MEETKALGRGIGRNEGVPASQARYAMAWCSRCSVCACFIVVALIAITDMNAGRPGTHHSARSQPYHAWSGDWETGLCSNEAKSATESAEAYVAQGRRNKDQGDYVEAVKAFERAIELHPENSEAHYMLFAIYEDMLKTYYRGGNDSEAVTWDVQDRIRAARGVAVMRFDEAIRRDPENAKVYYYRGRVHTWKGDPVSVKMAIGDFSKAVKLDPGYVSAYIHRGMARRLGGDHEGALKDFERAIELSPDSAEAYYARGSAYLERGFYEEAVANFVEAEAGEPGYTQAPHRISDLIKAYEERGKEHARKGNYEAAIVDFDRLIDLTSDSAWLYYRGLAYEGKGDYEQALSDLSKISAYYAIGNIHRRRGQPDKAIAAYREIISETEDNIPLHYNLGRAYSDKGDYESAITMYDKAIKLYPDRLAFHPTSMYLYYHRGIAHESRGEYGRADVDFAKAEHYARRLGFDDFLRRISEYKAERNTRSE